MTQTQPSLTLGRIEAALRGCGWSSPGPGVPPARTAAVYALFSERGGAPSVTIIRRSDSVSQHRGEYAFPGGGVEPHDSDLHATALREVTEELGVDPRDVEPWGRLDNQMTVTSGYLVVPFTGRLAEGARLNGAPAEVAEIVQVPVSSLADAANSRTISRLVAAEASRMAARAPGDGQGSSYELKTYDAYAYNGRIIWGATARILAQVISVLNAA